MKIIHLPFIKQLQKNLDQSPQFIQVILGPRQIGKTTGILHFLKSEYKPDQYIRFSR